MEAPWGLFFPLKTAGFYMCCDTCVSKVFFYLKVPKCEFFDRSDFHVFYTIKSLWEGDFKVKINIFSSQYVGVHLGPRNSLRVCSV